MTRVLCVINSLEKKAGSERVAINLANLFSDDLGFEIVIATRDSSDTVAFPLSPSIKVVRFPGNPFIFLYKIQSYLRKEKFDFVLIHNMGRLTLLMSCIKYKDI